MDVNLCCDVTMTALQYVTPTTSTSKYFYQYFRLFMVYDIEVVKNDYTMHLNSEQTRV